MAKAIVDLESKKTLNKSDVLLVSDAAGNMSKITTDTFKNQIGANNISISTDVAFLTATQKSFLIGGSSEKTASIVLGNYGSAEFDKNKKGTIFSVSDVFIVQGGSSSVKGKTITLEPSDKVKVNLKNNATFEIGDDLVANDDGIKISSLNANSIISKTLIIESDSDSVQIGASKGTFLIEAKGKNSKKQMESFVSLKGTEKAFELGLKGKTTLSVSDKLVSVTGTLQAKEVSAEIKTNKISSESLSVIYGKGQEAFSVNSQNMGSVDFKSNVTFEGTTTLNGLTDKAIESLKPEAGTIIFNSSKKAFQGFDGKAWKTFK